MTGIEFRVGRTDHQKVEEFLAGGPAGVGGVRLDAKNLAIHRDVAAAATGINAAVHVEPMTERFLVAGFNPTGIAYADRYLLDLGALISDPGDQARFVSDVIATQLGVATAITPPHFYVENSDQLGLNVALTRQAIALLENELPVRPIVAVSSTFLRQHAPEIARRYADAGVHGLELRISPFGGDDLGPIAVRRVLDALGSFRRTDLQITLGMAGTVGMAALALGLVDAISTGVGYREQFDHRSAMSSQRNASQREGGGGNPARVLLPGADVLVDRDVARHLYANTQIRTNLVCRIGHCANSLDGPVADLRSHYLHARAGQVADLVRQPATWRATGFRSQLTRAHELRAQIAQHLPAGSHAPRNRTIETLLGELDPRSAQRRSA